MMKTKIPFACHFHYSEYLLRIVVIFTAIIRTQCTAQMMNSHAVGVLLASVLIYLHQMQHAIAMLL